MLKDVSAFMQQGHEACLKTDAKDKTLNDGFVYMCVQAYASLTGQYELAAPYLH